MTYLEKYPDCKGCPVHEYCGTVISSIRLCHSYDDNADRDKPLPDEESIKQKVIHSAEQYGLLDEINYCVNHLGMSYVEAAEEWDIDY